MQSDRLYRAHRFLVRQSLYPLFLSSVLAMLLIAARVVRSGSGNYTGLPWNLFLAWIPYLVSLWAARLHGAWPGRWWLL